jgi:hypothetical protein
MNKCCRWCKWYKKEVCRNDEIETSLDVEVIETSDDDGSINYDYPEAKFKPENPESFYCSNFI